MLNSLSILNLIINLALIAGGFVAFRMGLVRTAEEIQQRVISALQCEITTLHDRVVVLEKENARLSQVIMTIKAALKERGLNITIDGELVSIHDRTGSFSQTARITGGPEEVQ